MATAIALAVPGRKFPTGQLLFSRGVADLCADSERASRDVWASLIRHARGDWGLVPPEDAKENELSLRRGFRLVSAYRVGTHKIWVITEADRSYTTVLFPDEY